MRGELALNRPWASRAWLHPPLKGFLAKAYTTEVARGGGFDLALREHQRLEHVGAGLVIRCDHLKQVGHRDHSSEIIALVHHE